MAQITKAVRQALDDQQKRNLSRELSEAVRAADLADRRTGVGRKLAVRLARHVVALANVARHIGLARETAAQGDWHAQVIVTEFEAQCEVRDRLLRKFLTGEYTDARLATLGLERWSRLVLAEEQARKKARPTARPDGKKPARGRAAPKGSIGTCRKCGKQGRLNEKGQCDYCAVAANTGNRTPPKGRRTKRATRVPDPGPGKNRASYHLAQLLGL